MVKKLKS